MYLAQLIRQKLRQTKTFSFLNSEAVVKKVTVDEDEIEFTIDGLEAKQLN